MNLLGLEINTKNGKYKLHVSEDKAQLLKIGEGIIKEYPFDIDIRDVLDDVLCDYNSKLVKDIKKSYNL